MKELIYLASDQIGTLIVLFFLAIVTILEKSKINFNPWSSLLKIIGKGINAELFDKINKIEDSVNALSNSVNQVDNKIEEQKAVSARTRMLRFGDEIRHEVLHSKDHYDQIMLDVTLYENYCSKHKDFLNGVTQSTVSLIKKKYQGHLEDNSFLI